MELGGTDKFCDFLCSHQGKKHYWRGNSITSGWEEHPVEITEARNAGNPQEKRRSIKRALQQSLLIRVRSMAPSLSTHCTILHLSHLFPGSQTDAISLPHPKPPIFFWPLPWSSASLYTIFRSKQHCRVIPNVVAKKKILNLKRSSKTHCIYTIVSIQYIIQNILSIYSMWQTGWNSKH